MNLFHAAFRWYMHPTPVRHLLNRIVDTCRLLPYETRVDIGAVDRPHYAYCLLRAARLAARLGYPRISAIEFGVAGGEGLLSLEYHAPRVERLTGVGIDTYGFDTGEGLPAPRDYRDLPYRWKAGFYTMDQEALRRRLTRSTLILGNVRDTIATFASRYTPAPVACIFHDMDHYSSTTESFRLFEIDERHRSPRIYNYFDDVTGTEAELHSDFTGELLAIADYNRANDARKLSRARHFSRYARQDWHEKVYIHHDFSHGHYTTFVGGGSEQLPLRT